MIIFSATFQSLSNVQKIIIINPTRSAKILFEITHPFWLYEREHCANRLYFPVSIIRYRHFSYRYLTVPLDWIPPVCTPTYVYWMSAILKKMVMYQFTVAKEIRECLNNKVTQLLTLYEQVRNLIHAAVWNIANHSKETFCPWVYVAMYITFYKNSCKTYFNLSCFFLKRWLIATNNIFLYTKISSIHI